MNLDTVEPRYNKDFGTMKITLLYQVSCYIRVTKGQFHGNGITNQRFWALI